MASVSLYDQFFCFIDGALLSENQEVDLTLEGDDQDVLTIVKGFAGQTPSPKKCTATLKNVIPPSGFEFDAFKAASTSAKHTMKLQSALTGKSITFEFFTRKPKITAGVGKTAMLDFEAHGGAAQFQ